MAPPDPNFVSGQKTISVRKSFQPFKGKPRPRPTRVSDDRTEMSDGRETLHPTRVTQHHRYRQIFKFADFLLDNSYPCLVNYKQISSLTTRLQSLARFELRGTRGLIPDLFGTW